MSGTVKYIVRRKLHTKAGLARIGATAPTLPASEVKRLLALGVIEEAPAPAPAKGNDSTPSADTSGKDTGGKPAGPKGGKG